MNITAIAIVALVCWAIVELINGPKGKKKNKYKKLIIYKIQKKNKHYKKF